MELQNDLNRSFGGRSVDLEEMFEDFVNKNIPDDDIGSFNNKIPFAQIKDHFDFVVRKCLRENKITKNNLC